MTEKVELAKTVMGPEPLDVPKPLPDDRRLYSVTTIIGTLDKPALLYWSAEQTAREAVRTVKSLPARIADTGEEAVIKWLRTARFRQPKGERSAADVGTAVHKACEEFALTGIRPDVDDELKPFLDRFEEWCQVFQPVYQAAEFTVYNPDAGYAGTCDAVMTVDGFRAITDYKTHMKPFDSRGKTSGAYPEVALQLSAYRFAPIAATWRPRRYEKWRRRYYLLGDEEASQGIAPPEVDGGLCIVITPTHCTAYPVACDQEVYTQFLYIAEAARWSFDLSKRVIGEPLYK